MDFILSNSKDCRSDTKRPASAPPEDRPATIRRVSSGSDDSLNSELSIISNPNYVRRATDDDYCGDAFPPLRDGLCSACQSISLDDMLTSDAKNAKERGHRNSTGFRLHNSVYEFGASVWNGCKLCRIILTESRHFLRHPETETYDVFIDALHGNFLSDMPIYLRLSNEGPGSRGTFEVCTGHESSHSIVASLEVAADDPGQ